MVVIHWTASEVLGWAEEIHLSPATIEIFRAKKFTGKDTSELDRPAMAELGISALDQSRILGNVHALLSTDTEDLGAGDGPAEPARAASTSSRRQTISYTTKNMPDNLRLLKSRVWELFQHDVVASRTTRLFVEGDLVKYQDKKGGQTRRFLLLDSCLLWCSVKSRGKTPEMDQLTLKGRLDSGLFSVIDLADGTKHGKKVLHNAFKIFNKDKEKWYTLVAPDPSSKTQWLQGFADAGVVTEKSSAFDPAKYDLPELTADLSNEEAMAIMIKVRDGKLAVDAALDLAKETAASNKQEAEAESEPSAASPASDSTGADEGAAGESAAAVATAATHDDDDADELILVLGATGTIGSRVADKLLDAGARVRLGARKPEKLAEMAARGADVVEFDFDDRDGWLACLVGCESIFINTAVGEGTSAKVVSLIEAAKEAGVKHITKLSAFGMPPADTPPLADGGNLYNEHHAADAAVTTSGLGWSLIKPSWFMSNFLGHQGESLAAAEPCFYGASAEGATTYVSPDDVADVAVATLSTPAAHAGKAYDVTGPEALTDVQVAAALSKHLGTEVKYVDLSPEALGASLKEKGVPEWIADGMVGLEKLKASGFASTVTTVVSEVLGRQPVSLADYLDPPTSEAAAAPAAAPEEAPKETEAAAEAPATAEPTAEDGVAAVAPTESAEPTEEAPSTEAEAGAGES